MSTYSQMKKQIAQLEKQAAELKKAEAVKVIASIRAQIETYGLTAEDLGFGTNRSKAPTKKAQKAVPKYLDPKTGKTWNGIGKAPGWIAGKDRNSFLIAVSGAKPAEPASSTNTKVPAKPSTAKSAAKAVAKSKPVAKAVAKGVAKPAKPIAKSPEKKSSDPVKKPVKAKSKKPAAAKSVAAKPATKAASSAKVDKSPVAK